MKQLKTKQLPIIPTQNLFSRGWEILTKHLGYANATRFVMECPLQYGDSVKEIRKFRQKWTTVNQLDKEIKKAKKRKEI